VYGPREDIYFFGRLHPVDVLIEVTISDHFLIQNFILVGHAVDLKPSSLFKLNFSHLESPDFHAYVSL